MTPREKRRSRERDLPEARALRALYPHKYECLSFDTNGGICDCDALRLRREHKAKEVRDA